MSLRTTLSLLAATSVLAQIAIAEELVENQTNSALNAFYGLCYSEQFDAEKLPSLAHRMGWEQLDEEQTLALFPKATPSLFDFHSAYLIETPTEPPLPGVAFGGKGRENGRTVQVCTLSFNGVLWSEVWNALIEDETLQFISSDKYEGHEMHSFKSIVVEQGFVGLETRATDRRGVRINFIRRY